MVAEHCVKLQASFTLHPFRLTSQWQYMNVLSETTVSRSLHCCPREQFHWDKKRFLFNSLSGTQKGKMRPVINQSRFHVQTSFRENGLDTQTRIMLYICNRCLGLGCSRWTVFHNTSMVPHRTCPLQDLSTRSYNDTTSTCVALSTLVCNSLVEPPFLLPRHSLTILSSLNCMPAMVDHHSQ